MIVSERRKASDYAKRVNDLDVGDYVLHLVSRRKGIVLCVEDGFATVDYLDGSSDCLLPAAFRKLRGRRKDSGHSLDVRSRK